VCGINALFSYITNVRDVDERELLATREAMRSRGPDAGGAWISDDRRVGLAHRRLSIIDTGERANQPMFTADRALAIVFNGEIYNYRELRAELARGGAAFQTTSDTEVLLELYRRDGDAMFDRMRGMYAFALWDARTRTMLLGRDPYGIKPLYYATEGGVLRVASQVRALVAGGGVSLARDSAGICGFLLRGSVPEPFTTYAAIRALPAGTSMRVSAAGVEEPRRHFSLAATLRDAVRQRVDVGDEQRRAMICDAVQQSVRDHLVADVPIGAFLSAGRDSGTIVGLAAENGPPLQTVTLRFDEYAGTAKDEAPLASLVARHYGTEHFTNTLDEATFREELPRALAAMDQPSIDGLNSYFVCRAAAQLGWKVALSGTGGDELFGGYSTFRTIPRTARTYRLFRHMPFVGDAVVAMHAAMFPRTNVHFSPKSGSMPKYGHSYEGAYLLKRGLFLPHELAEIVGEEYARDALQRLAINDLMRAVITPDPGTPFARVAALESGLFMRNQLLRDLDWASMAHSLEVRVPLVDAFLLRQIAPLVVNAPRRDGKRMLALAPRRPLPEAIMTRRKTGFTLPMKKWLPDDGAASAYAFGMRSWALHLTREMRPSRISA
jgi:asparagine synthase (glutamine-hydrolysing)